MSTLRMTSDLRRQLILSAAKRCFARHGFAGTTTRSVAAAAAISEGLLFKHFPSKAALYAEILTEECEADPDLAHLLGQAPSTATLVELVKGMVRHFLQISEGPDQQEAQRLRLMTTSSSRRWRIRAAALRQGRQPDRPGIHRLARSRGGGRRCIACRMRAAQSVLVCASHRADGSAGETAGRPLPDLRPCRRSRAATVRIHPPRHRTWRRRNCFPPGPRDVAGFGSIDSRRRCMT